jgi:hypothetical protein
MRVIAVLAGTAAFGLAAAAQAAAPVAIYDYNGQREVKPATVFLTADAGPYVRKIKWSRWGSKRAVGHGQYVSTCASCAPPRHRAATITLTKLASCHKHGGSSYKVGTLRTGADVTGKPKTIAFDTGYLFCSH